MKVCNATPTYHPCSVGKHTSQLYPYDASGEGFIKLQSARSNIYSLPRMRVRQTQLIKSMKRLNVCDTPPYGNNSTLRISVTKGRPRHSMKTRVCNKQQLAVKHELHSSSGARTMLRSVAPRGDRYRQCDHSCKATISIKVQFPKETVSMKSAYLAVWSPWAALVRFLGPAHQLTTPSSLSESACLPSTYLHSSRQKVVAWTLDRQRVGKTRSACQYYTKCVPVQYGMRDSTASKDKVQAISCVQSRRPTSRV